jgi:hypothetical protein
MLGRPLAFASHHFDTQLPSYCDPAIDKTGRFYLPNIALFKLAYILGDIMDDAVSVRPVPYENVLANDRALTQWMENLPEELDLDEYRTARNLASQNFNLRRLGVQSIIIRTSYYHIRFTLHRPFASSLPNGLKGRTVDPHNCAQSLEIAVSAADKLINLIGQAHPDFLSNTSVAIPGHMNWGPFHCFSAAMFFSFQLISNPDQPGAGLFRRYIQKAISILQQSKGSVVADKGYNILIELAPLYSVDFRQTPLDQREKERARILRVVRKLAFPYHDSYEPRRFNGDSPYSSGSPGQSTSLSPPNHNYPYDSQLPPALDSHGAIPSSVPSAVLPSVSSVIPNGLNGTSSYSSQEAFMPQNPYDQRFQPGVHITDASMWGAAVGFEHSEWTQFLEGLRPMGPPLT